MEAQLVMIALQYESNYLKFQVNPESIKKEIGSSSENANVYGLGDISIPTSPSLAKININSFFWQERNLVPVNEYIQWLETWQKSKKPAKLIVTIPNYSMMVTCENFNHERKAGEEFDVYFELELKEYRPYGAIKLEQLQNFGDDADVDVAKVLVEIPRPTRDIINKVFFRSPYKTWKGDTLCSISQKITKNSMNWKQLYNENKWISKYICEGNEIPEGLELTLPKAWTS